MAQLFTPLSIKDVVLRNRIGISPMCQYAAHDGVVNDWHLAHLGARAVGGAGLVLTEATAVSAAGRITPQCAGLWNEQQIEPWARVAAFIKAQGAVPGMQLAHAGRKASSLAPWQEGGRQLAAHEVGAWQPVAPSAMAFGGNTTRVPQALSRADIQQVQRDFVAAAQRALRAGFQWLELHFAHGYLAQSFLASLSNQRDDEYGGELAGRSRFLLECFSAVREVWPERLPLTMRLGVTDFHPEGQSLQEAIEVIRALADRGLDLIDVSIGFNRVDISGIPWGPGFMAPIAAQVRAATQLPVAVSWMIQDARQAEAIIAQQQADLVLLARASLADPHWPYHAAKELGLAKSATLLPTAYADWLRDRF